MIRSLLWWVSAGLVAGGCFAQTQLPPQYRLSKVRTVPSQVAVRTLLMPVKCDAEGNLYFRSLDGQRAKDAVRTLKQIHPDGSVGAWYSFPNAPELAGVDAYDFAVSPQGEVYAPAAGQAETFLVEFTRQGTVRSKTKLSRLFKPSQVAVFKSGEFLVSGVELPEKAEMKHPKAFTAIFAKDGRLIHEVSLKETQKATEDQADTDEQSKNNSDLSGINAEVDLGLALLGEDGNAYLLRRTNPAVVHVISPGGEVVRTLKIETTHGSMKANPQAMFLAQQKILLLFSDEKESFFLLADAQSGEIQEEYFATADLGEAVACYTGQEFVFMGTQNGKLQLIYAQPGPAILKTESNKQ